MPYRRNLIRRFSGLLFLASLTLCLWLGQFLHNGHLSWSASATAQTTNAAQLVQQGVDRYQAGNYLESIKAWKAALEEYQKRNDRPSTALVLENLARAYEQLGQTDQSIAHWEQLSKLYRQANNLPQEGRVLIELAQTYSRIGQPRKAIALLCNPDDQGNCAKDSTLHLLRTSHYATLEVAALGSLGDAYRLIGEYDQAITKALEPGLQLAKELKHVAYQRSILNSLGNAYLSRAQVNYRRATAALQRGNQKASKAAQEKGLQADQDALVQFEASKALAQTQGDQSGDQPSELRSLLGAIPAHYRTGETLSATNALAKATQLLTVLPNNRERVYMTIDLAQLLQPESATGTLPKNRCSQTPSPPQAEALLRQAIDSARQLQDDRAASFALGALGHLYECRSDYAKALDWTAQARWAADQALHAKDSLYLWEWQTGRILNAQQQTKEAIKAYERSLATLETIRGDILIAERDIQFDFRDGVEPIYRELVALKLSQEQPVSTWSKTKDVSASKQDFQSILGTIDALKLAELQDYFGSECIIVAASQAGGNSKVETGTAVFNTFILEQQMAVILSLPNGQKKFAWVDMPRSALLEQINAFRQSLQSYRNREAYDTEPAQQVYDWLIRPFAKDLEQEKIKTLVFVQDGILRSIPMAALHNGEKFLIQQYAIAITPSLPLTDRTPLKRNELRVLALGLTEGKTVEGEKFQPLDYVGKETSAVTAALPGSKLLLNGAFTSDQLQKELGQTAYPIVHIATHGKFGTDPKDTFIITGNGEKLTLTDLEKLIRRKSRNQEPLELLALTACETAVGDDRSALGLAGVALQAGAKSALASLWSINDTATATVATDFYAHLRNSTRTKAEALQAAQVALLEQPQYAHPAYWSPFILIGNWQ